MSVIRSGGGQYFKQRVVAPLIPIGTIGERVAVNAPLSLLTPGLTHRRFPFDSPMFDFYVDFEPPLPLQAVRFANRTDSFVLACETMEASWGKPGRLHVRVLVRRNPFVQATVAIVGIGALAFALLLTQLGSIDSIATATGSYFLSVWSLRGIVGKAIKSFQPLLDIWLLFVSVVVILIVAWKLIDFRGATRGGRVKPTRTPLADAPDF